MRLINIRLMNCWYSIKISMKQFFYFIHILVRKHVKASEISSVKPLKIIDLECITDTDSSSTLVIFLVFKTCLWSIIRYNKIIILNTIKISWLNACILRQYIEQMVDGQRDTGPRIQDPGTDIVYLSHMWMEEHFFLSFLEIIMIHT